MRDTYDMLEYLEYLLHDTSASMWSAVKKLMALNAAYDQVTNRVIELHENFFYKTATLTPGTATLEATPYAFPAAPAGISKILFITDTDGVPVEPITLQQRDYSYPAVADRNIQMGYWLDHNQLWVNADAFTGNLRLYYIRKPGRMQYGTAEAGDSTTMTLDLDTRPSIVNDYYNSMAFTIRSGTGVGEEATASDYVGSTRVLTIDFTTTPDNTSVYATVSELPDGHNEIVVMGAAIRALMFDVTQQPKLEQFRGWYTKLEFDLMDFLQNRQTQKSRSVFMRNLD
jgi:hypothetical protein